MLAHLDDYFETPQWLFDKIEASTGLKFKTDMCASIENTKVSENYITEESNLFEFSYFPTPGFCNPPRSKNGKFVNKVYDYWQENNVDIVMLLCWNDLGNKYGEKLLPHILNNEIEIRNLGKVIFDKNGVKSKYPSRLTYCWVWFKKA